MHRSIVILTTIISIIFTLEAHACGVAFVRLRKPMAYYTEQYQDPTWGMKKLLTLMERQRHRGQDGAGIAAVKFDVPVGQEYARSLKFASKNALDQVFEQATIDMVKRGQAEYLGEAMLGHIRYATYSGFDTKFCQPFVRSHSIPGLHITFAGNFNLTNTKEIVEKLQEWGIAPISESDTHIVLESLTYQLDREHDILKRQSKLSGRKGIQQAEQNLDLLKVLRNAAAHWDGGYVFCGVLGNGDSFCCRDAAGIRPGYYYANDEIFAVASERVALMDTFDVPLNEVKEIMPGHAIVIKRNGEIADGRFADSLPERQCSFERIYFSKANDPQIYQERKALGRTLAQRVYDEINGDLEHTVFTYVPNSSLPAFQGLVDQISAISGKNAFRMLEKNVEKNTRAVSNIDEIGHLMQTGVRSEFIVAKNQKMRTFISSDQERVDLGIRLYEVTHGIVKPQDTLVVVDDSLVRGTTFRDLLMKKLTSLNPKKIILVISAPPVMYPDCYGIDMSQLGKFVAFQAAVEILKERKQEAILQEVRTLSLQQAKLPSKKMQNYVKKIYSSISHEDLTNKIAQLITPKNMTWKGDFKVIYQTEEGLHAAIPNHRGDWYFSGKYPTSGGYQVLNNAYLNWIDGASGRSY
ncbi:MAG TPA: amidophosphoribosyltransferase [Gammaproteobacteria bacterium]|nr:amidophosphoribosyltransferase [Gammaproteobacteria bacterium]